MAQVRYTEFQTLPYNNVPQFIFDGLLKAQSKGRFFDTFIRDKFPTSRY
ncbi:KTSC domain-containing protein [Acetobacter sp.]|nr:KTSC domain-containing protein [Acetobacter sp.]